ncbi:MAG: manganese efflux pump MntP family protein [Bacteroidales bacterium]|nr:manganese efflux pump MntP family protein [Bacteroidales bacterium]MDD3664200.1 manganese efflux pump MntP family protein [Bacteroidales bacterium]
MDFWFVLLLAVGLCFDSFAVSVSTGLAVPHITFLRATRVALILAVFQGVMPLIGYFFGRQIEPLIGSWDHWIAFTLLSVLGLKMIRESFGAPEEAKAKSDPLSWHVLLWMAIATSIDALAVGFSFTFLEVSVLTAVITIAFVTYLAGMLGMLAGKTTGPRLGKRMEIVGGIILIGIGIKILIQHIQG